MVVIVAALLASHTFLFQGGGGFSPSLTLSLSLSLSYSPLSLCEGHDDRSNSRKVRNANISTNIRFAERTACALARVHTNLYDAFEIQIQTNVSNLQGAILIFLFLFFRHEKSARSFLSASNSSFNFSLKPVTASASFNFGFFFGITKDRSNALEAATSSRTRFRTASSAS